MARIKIVDIPKDLKISKEEMKKVLGALKHGVEPSFALKHGVEPSFALKHGVELRILINLPQMF